MQSNTISKLLASSIAAVVLVAASMPTIAAPYSGSSAQQTGKADCKQNPNDPRCTKK